MKKPKYQIGDIIYGEAYNLSFDPDKLNKTKLKVEDKVNFVCTGGIFKDKVWYHLSASGLYIQESDIIKIR